MPPKKDAKAGAKEAPLPPGGQVLDPELAAERLLLIEQCKLLKAQKLNEQGQAASLAEEKEKLNFFWLAAKKELEEKRALLRDKAREKADLAERHDVEIKVYKQRIKHLLFEHQAEVSDVRVEGQVAAKLADATQRDSERELKADKRDLKVVLKEMEAAHEDYMRALRMEQDRAVTEMRLAFERRTHELQAVYEDRMGRTREQLNQAREDEIRAIEKRKSKHLAALISAHEKAFVDIKTYYNEITHSNLDLVKSLKEEVADLRKKEAGDERVMFAIAQQNKKMSEPMRKALEEVRRLREEREAYRRDIAELHETKARILVAQDALENARWEHEILEQRAERLSSERDALYDRFQAAIHAVAQKGGFKHLLLERRVGKAMEDIERASLTLTEVLRSAHLDATALGGVQSRVEEAAAGKDAVIGALQGELAAVAEAHDRALERYRAKLREFGIPQEELGFQPATSVDLLAQLELGGAVGGGASSAAASGTARGMTGLLGSLKAGQATAAGGAGGRTPAGGR